MDNITRLKEALEWMDALHELLRKDGKGRYINFYAHNQIKAVLEDLQKQQENKK